MRHCPLLYETFFIELTRLYKEETVLRRCRRCYLASDRFIFLLDSTDMTNQRSWLKLNLSPTPNQSAFADERSPRTTLSQSERCSE